MIINESISLLHSIEIEDNNLTNDISRMISSFAKWYTSDFIRDNIDLTVDNPDIIVCKINGIHEDFLYIVISKGQGHLILYYYNSFNKFIISPNSMDYMLGIVHILINQSMYSLDTIELFEESGSNLATLNMKQWGTPRKKLLSNILMYLHLHGIRDTFVNDYKNNSTIYIGVNVETDIELELNVYNEMDSTNTDPTAKWMIEDIPEFDGTNEKLSLVYMLSLVTPMRVADKLLVTKDLNEVVKQLQYILNLPGGERGC